MNTKAIFASSMCGAIVFGAFQLTHGHLTVVRSRGEGKGWRGGVGGERLEGRLEGRSWRGGWRGEVGGGVGGERLKGRGLEEGVRGGVGAFQPCLGGTLSSAPAMARAP